MKVQLAQVKRLIVKEAPKADLGALFFYIGFLAGDRNEWTNLEKATSTACSKCYTPRVPTLAAG